ncbi:hypothetical protein GCM10028806_28170 [Spirosoma terrae]|uniref:Helix-turn-helix domain-containing protein n=1 Tax=Spirosoma terrae TaxID=1968276 RepID=A0A6L9L9T5_9BACT|nr:helix-turn-helix domain-containing protein [Spirosoma terrae]NDU97220.1 helix-turn-helix domain-containing protein [Spirosoma terrae]
MKVSVDIELLSTLQATLEAARLEIKKAKDREQGNEPLSIEEAAKYLKVSRTTLHTYVKSNQIVPSEFGNRVWITRSELDRFIERHRRKVYA